MADSLARRDAVARRRRRSKHAVYTEFFERAQDEMRRDQHMFYSSMGTWSGTPTGRLERLEFADRFYHKKKAWMRYGDPTAVKAALLDYIFGAEPIALFAEYSSHARRVQSEFILLSFVKTRLQPSVEAAREQCVLQEQNFRGATASTMWNQVLRERAWEGLEILGLVMPFVPRMKLHPLL